MAASVASDVGCQKALNGSPKACAVISVSALTAVLDDR